MYHFFMSLEQIGESHICITGDGVNHIKGVLHMKPGEQVLVNSRMGKDYHCEIDKVSLEEVTTRILSVSGEGTELPTKLYLFQRLPRSDKMELTIQRAMELGMYQMVPAMTKRAVVKLDVKKEEARVRRWDSVAENTTKQSRRLIIPEVTGVISLSKTLTFAKNLDVNLIPFEHAEGMARTRKELGRVGPGKSVDIFVEPEDGFEDSEIEAVYEAGIRPVALGGRILRTETAGFTILSVLVFQLGS